MSEFHSEFIDRVNYMYKKTDGDIQYPNSYDGDCLKMGYKEIVFLIVLLKALTRQNKRLTNKIERGKK